MSPLLHGTPNKSKYSRGNEGGGSINEGGDSINEGGGSINEGVTDTPSIQLWLSPKVCTFGMSAEFENSVPGKGASAIRRALPIPLTTECVLLLQNVFSHYRVCSLTIRKGRFGNPQSLANTSHYRMCSLTTECVLTL